MIKIITTAILFLLINNISSAQFTSDLKKKVHYDYLLYLPQEYKSDTTKYPLVIYLHGASHRGNDLNKLKEWGLPGEVAGGVNFPFIIVSPQCPENKYWSTENWLDTLLSEISSKYSVDKNRIYLTGISMGGYGTWGTAIKHPDVFAAIIPLCGGGDTTKVDAIKKVPIWTFHGTRDNLVPFSETENMVNKLINCGGNVIFSKLEGRGHNISSVYKDKSIYEWLLKQSKKVE